MLPSKLAFVDIETTGMSASINRIIEIGIVRVEDNQIVQQYNQLINPQCHIPPEITMLTGITGRDLDNKPTFQEVKRHIFEAIDQCIFVAHNARFDYGFLKHEFAREGIMFAPKQCCTVKLSRRLFPTERHHNLDSIMQRFGLHCTTRHRAYDDAHLLYQFFNKLQQLFDLSALEDAINVAMKKPSLPSKLKQEDIDTLPEEPGVYLFYDEQDTPLYVGKSINIKERVLSHFSADIHSSKEMNISQQIARIETKVTAGEVGALFTESRLVKQLLPIYNRQLRQKRELVALTTENDLHGYPTVHMETLTKIEPGKLSSFIGFFRSKKQAKDYLTRMVKEHQLCDKLLGVEKTNSACFSHRLGICKGACVQKELPIKYLIRFLTAFAGLKVKPWPFAGPIAIEEYNPLSQKKEYFVVDKWCYIGSLKYENDLMQDEFDQEVQFDLDTYKILRRFFSQGKHAKQIKLLSELPYSTMTVPVI